MRVYSGQNWIKPIEKCRPLMLTPHNVMLALGILQTYTQIISLKTFITADSFTCHGRKSTDATDNTNNGSIKRSWKAALVNYSRYYIRVMDFEK